MHSEKKARSALSRERTLECDSDCPQVGSARSNCTRLVELNSRKTNCRNIRPYCSNTVNLLVLLQ
jgi:hypothetical protein